ncbi:hypothetical protein [Rhizobium sp. SU303]|uniref:hypothetical protein n=1 Tax=Rhizobium sp. SU303 TaxID=3138065 RepID=UPI001E5A9E93|nr:hypothetical protein [Rhizobium leguminosarum]UFW80036.1 hypothetical protein RlegSU303_08990 [Rhizobium leguminosarum bv. viciae]
MAQVPSIFVLDKDGVPREVATLTAIAALLGESQDIPSEYTLLDRVKAISTALGATLAVNQVSVARSVTATITRAANTNVYDAGDIVGGPITFTAAGKAGGAPALINSVQFKMNVAAVPAGLGAFRLHLYSVTPPSNLVDGDPFDLPIGDDPAYLGFIDIPKPIDLGSALYVEVNNIGKQVKLNSGNVYAYLQTIAGFPGGSGDVYKPTIHTAEV